jgi:hypothetical protein
MRSLLWKEWHEQRWKLAFGSLILAAFALIGLRSRVVADELLLESVCLLAVLLLPVLASTGLLPAERSDRTLSTLLALPVRPRLVFEVKTLIGVLLCAIPIVVTAAVSIIVAGGREISPDAMIELYLRTLIVAVYLFFWMFTLTVSLPTETRAALIAMGILIGWLIITLGLSQAWRMNVSPPNDPSAFWALDPFVFLLGFKGRAWAVSLPIAGVIQGIIALLLWLWAAWRLTLEAEGRS